MDREEDIVDLYERASSRVWMPIVILLAYFPGSEEEDVIDRVERESQYLPISGVHLAMYVEHKEIHT